MTNMILKGCKEMMRVTVNLLKDGGWSRHYATTIADYKISWQRPEKPSPFTSESSYDQGVHVDLKPTDLSTIYSQSPEMKDASDIVKRMFSYKFLPRKNLRQGRKEIVLDVVRGHDLEKGSLHVKIAALTSDIYMMQETIKEYPRNGRARAELKEKIDERRKYMRILRQKDYKCFEWVLEKMNLTYKPNPSPPVQITRKESLRRLTEKYCNKVIQGKLDDYKAELKAMQKDFYTEKAEKLAFIREEEIACGLKPTVSAEEIALTRQKAKECQT